MKLCSKSFYSEMIYRTLENILSVIQLNFEDHTYTFTQRVCNLNSLNMCVASLKCIAFLFPSEKWVNNLGRKRNEVIIKNVCLFLYFINL